MNDSYLKNNSPRAIVVGLLTAVVLTMVVTNRLVHSAPAEPADLQPGLSVPGTSTSAAIADSYGKLPLRFEANEGQTDPQVKFLSRGPGYDLFLTATTAVLTLRKSQSPPPDNLGAPAPAKDSPSVSVLRLKMIGANPEARVAGQDELPGKVNYLIGNNPEKWHANIPIYGKVYYKEIYPGVDMVYYGNQRQLEYDFVIAPHADPRSVKFNLEGAQKLRIDGTGDLVITVDRSEVRLRKPMIYQITDQGERNEVSGRYALRGHEVSFNVRNYDSKKALIIDPVLSYSSYFGPAAVALAITVDASGNAYLTGRATSANFPTTAGSFKPSAPQDVPDAFVTKLNSTGTALVYSTFLGGSSGDVGNGIAVDSSGNAFVTGETDSTNFPTINPIRSSTSNFLTTVDTGGHWSGQFIGPPNGAVNVLVVDPLTPGTIYAGMGSNGGGGVYKTTDGGLNWVGLNTGLTNVNCPALVIDPTTPATLYASLNLSNSPGAGLYKSVDAGSTWTMLTNGLNGITVSALAIDPSSPATVYAGAVAFGLYKSTNAGASWINSSTGINFGGISAIAVDPANSATVYASAGGGGVFKTTNSAGNWSQVNTGLTNTNIRVLAIDSASNVYAGSSGGGLFKSTNGAGNWSPLNNGLPTFTFVSSLALNSNASTIFIGTPDGRIYKSSDSGANWIISYETLTRTSFNALIINPTSSSVLYAGASIQGSLLFDHEAFVAKLNPSGSALVYSTYLGGNKDDTGRGIAVDSAGIAYVTGQTASATFPLAAAFQPTLKGTSDAFVTAFNPTGTALVYSTFLGGDGFETANAVATDGSGNAYVAGSTGSLNFPLANAFQASLSEGIFGSDAFVTKFSSTGALAYSTYLGGDGGDTGYGIAADSSGNAYIAGTSNSTNFPTANPIQPTNLGGFVTKLNNLGSGLVYSTYLANSRGIAVDPAGNAYVTGFTNSAEFPLVVGSLRTKSPFYTNTNGVSWTNDNYGLKSEIVNVLTLDPTNPRTIYAGTRSGVFKSIDSGRNWNAINTGLVRPNVVALVVDPITPATVYLGVNFSDFSNSTGVYKSTNGGSTWSAVNNGLGNGGVLSLAIDPVTPSTLYAGFGGGVFKTTNSGGSWSIAGQALSFIESIAINPITPTTIYAGGNSSGGGVYRSIDSGANWQSVNNGLESNFVLSLGIDPITPSTIYAGLNGGLYKSVNGGDSWTPINNGLPGLFINDIVFDPVTPATIYVATGSGGGVARSTNGGANWTPIGSGFRAGFVICIAVNPLKPSTLYAGAQNFPSDNDAFVTKINPSGSAFVYSTLLGGSANPFDGTGLSDEAYGIAVDPSGNAYVTGSTREPDFPTTPDVYLPVPVGGSFISKLAMSYLISGQVLDGSNAPVSGAEVTLSDGVSLTSMVTESDGFYQFSHLREGGSFTVSAAKPHFTMTPPSQTFNNLNSNQTLNFIATATIAPFYSISGTVTNNGVGLGGATVTLGGSQSLVRTTDSNGNYSFTVAGGGNYTVTPSLLGFTFSPPSLTFNNLGADQTTANFAATRQNFVVTNANNHGTGSLRQAILDANATAGLDTIVFNIPGVGVHTIELLISLPEITDPVIIDATTQPGYAGAPLIELNGFQAAGGRGLSITAGGSTIRGLAIGRFTDYGIVLGPGGNNIIQANYIGIDPSGTLRRSNNVGIILNNSSNNLIGGTTAATRNVISGNNFHGINMTGFGNQVTGNFIGTNATGTAALGNGFNGVEVFTTGTSTGNNVIGGTASGAGNLISGNTRGITLTSSATLTQGNLIGTDVTGTLAVGNGIGIYTLSADTIIGGTVPAARNIISGNTSDGVTISGPGSRLEGNFIGVDITGTVALGNGGSGVVAGNGALIGGITPAARNVISGNGGNGGFGNISLGSNNSGAQATVQGNYIGTDVTGNVALNNPLAGIWITGSSNLIGGLVPGAQNVISGNQVGIQIGGASFPGPTGNTIQGNLIGLNALGTGALTNSQGGIRVSDSSNNTIGGDQNGAGNRISFNGGPGINVSSGFGNTVRGNSIFSNSGLGMDLTPDGVTANDVGDADSGPNNLQNFPVLTSVTSDGSTTTINGTLNSIPNTTFRIDFYSNAACDPLGNGEGAQVLGSTNVTTAANGDAAINANIPMALANGRVVTATATDPSGNTSEFSACNPSEAAGSVQFGDGAYNVLEDVGNAAITVIRSGGSKGTISVNYSTAAGTATSGVDYTAISGTLVFGDGELSKTLTLPIINDAITEPAETLQVILTSPGNLESLGAPATATVNIQDSNTPLFLNMNSVDVTEGNSGTTNAVVTVILSAATGRTVTADFSTSPSSATSGVDFTATSGSLTFGPGVTSRTISVPIIGDTLNEANETFLVSLSNPVNATTGDVSLVRILNDDPLPSLSISDVSVSEGNSGAVNMVFNVNLSTVSGRSLSVGYATANGTATAPGDYTATSGRVTFTAGQLLQTITVVVVGDTALEPNETIFVNLGGPANATISDNQATGTILNDDAQANISFSQGIYSVAESDGLTTITVNRAGDLSGPATVDYAATDNSGSATVVPCSTANGNASSRCDFTTALGTLRFAAGENSKSFLVLISQDNYVEGAESLTLTLSNVTGNTGLATPSTASLTITDDATEPPTNPIDTADAFVRQHYHDFLNREPDAAGLAFWTNQITECQQPGATCNADVRRINVSAAFFLSIEFQETGYLVYRFYKSAYGNLPGTPVPLRLDEFLPDTQQIGKDVVIGQPGAEQQLEANKVAYALDFVSRSRFTSAYPTTLTPAQFVDALFTNAGVTPSATDRNAAINEFGGAGNTADTLARARALRRVAENSTLKQQETNKAFVLMQYFGYLRRNPNDPPEAGLNFDGYNFWLGKLNEFNGNFVNAEMVKAFIVSGEYRHRFGP
jgi:hypothetical protein